MKKEIYNIEGIEIEVEKYDKNDKNKLMQIRFFLYFWYNSIIPLR